MAADDAYDLAYRAAVRALDHQMAAVSELRNRASLLFAAASITVSLLGDRAFSAPFGWLAIGCFMLLSGCVLVIVWPHKAWRYDPDPSALLAEHLASQEATAATLCTNLLAHMADSRRVNTRNLVYIAAVFRAGVCLLAIQMLATVVAASGGS